MTQSKEANKEAKGSREGTWKRGVTRSPCTKGGLPLDVEIGLKRKSEGLHRDIVGKVTKE